MIIIKSWKVINNNDLQRFCNINITEIKNIMCKNFYMGIRKLKNNIAKKVKRLRLERGISQEKLAESINMSREHISCIERGKNLTSVETLYYLAEFFQINIEDFFHKFLYYSDN